MKFSLKQVVIGLAVLTVVSSCVSSKKYNALMEEKDSLSKSLAESQETIKVLEEEKAQLMDQNGQLSSELGGIKKDLSALQSEMSQVKQMVAQKEAELNKVKGEIKESFAIYEKAGLNIVADGDFVYISMPENVLFRSGSAYLDKHDKEIIETLANVMKANPDLKVVVEGHTDDQKMKPGAPYRDNWDLSVARATAVVRYMTKMGVDPSQVEAAGKGEYAPKVAEKTAEARKMNRRTEFVIVPKTSKLYQLVK